MGKHLIELLGRIERKELEKARDRIVQAREAAKTEYARLGNRDAVRKARAEAKLDYQRASADLKHVEAALEQAKPDKTTKVLSGAAKASAERKAKSVRNRQQTAKPQQERVQAAKESVEVAASDGNGAAAPPEQQPQEEEHEETPYGTWGDDPVEPAPKKKQ